MLIALEVKLGAASPDYIVIKFEPHRIALKRTATQAFGKYDLLLDKKTELYQAQISVQKENAIFDFHE